MNPEVEQRNNDLQRTIDKLSNGHRGDPNAMSEGIVIMCKTLQIMLLRNYVSKEECEISHNCMKSEIEKAKFSWKKLAAVLVACSTFYGLGIHLINTVWQPAQTNMPVAELIIQSKTQQKTQ